MDLERLSKAVGEALLARGWTLATAESCTGGLLGHLLTQIPGSSAYYLGGVIAYSNHAKERILGVPAETLLRHGAVSPETAVAMAQGAVRLLGADVAVGITGIAGPGGGTRVKPVGLVYLGLVWPGGEGWRRFVWPHDRAGNKAASARAALEWILEVAGGRFR